MAQRSRVSPWLQMATLFGLFLLGGGLGWALADWSAPGSGFAAGLSGMLLPAAYSIGLLTWGGLDLLRSVFGRARRDPAHTDRLAARSGRWFVPLSLLFALVGGALAGAVPGGQGVWASAGGYGLVGALYGWLVARLAAAGWLPAPEWG